MTTLSVVVADINLRVEDGRVIAEPFGSSFIAALVTAAQESADTAQDILNAFEAGPAGTIVTLPVESGWAASFEDSAGRTAGGFRPDGTFEPLKLQAPAASIDAAALTPDLTDLLGEALAADSGWLLTFEDGQARVALGVRDDGSVFAKGAGDDLPGAEYLIPSPNIWCLGDSLTSGSGGQTTWVTALESSLPSRVVHNDGIGGQTSVQIIARAGARPALLTVTGDLIPTSGAVTVTAIDNRLLSTPSTDNTTRSRMGWLGGIYGTLSCVESPSGDASDAYSFTRQTAGTATWLAPKSAFVPDVAGRDLWTTVIFIGRNNIVPADVQRDIAATVSRLKSLDKRFLIITPPNGGSITPGVATNEGVGTSTYDNIVLIEDWAAKEYGDRVLKSRPYSWQFNSGSADDLDDVAKGTVPRSLRIDGVHWTTAFHAHVRNWVLSEITRRSW